MRAFRTLLLGTALSFATVAPLHGQFPEGAVRMIEVSGQPTRVLTLGLDGRVAGSPVLFLHAGGGVTLEGWAPWLISVSEIVPIVAYDRIGIGGSPFDGVEPTFDRVVTHAHELLATLDVPPPHVLAGHSIGAVIIVRYAARYPNEVGGLVHLDPTEFRLSAQEWVQASSDEESEARWLDLMDLSSTGSPGVVAFDKMVDAFLQMPAAERRLPADPDIPTAVVLGTKAIGEEEELSWWTEDFSRIAQERSVTHWTRALEGLSHGTLIVVNDAGHFVFRDAPGLATEAVRRVVSTR
jgi:pimeloyl-ACP methyl ester carboxylesterase